MAPALRFADPEFDGLDDIVDLETYPLGQTDSPAWLSAVSRCQRELADEGCCSIPGFLREDALDQARGELAALAPKAAIRDKCSSVYARSSAELDLPADDPRGITLCRRIGHVTRDQIPPDAVVQRLYVAPSFKRFIAACLTRTRVFEYADPLAGLVTTVIPPGGVLPWHYDTNEYVVTIMTQQPDGGGRFEYSPGLRSPGNENLAGLAEVLDREPPELIRSRQLRPGDLQLFMGRYSLHRVTKIDGSTQRHVAVLSYADRPGVIGPVDRTRSVYGRVTEAHLVAEELAGEAPDGLIY